MDAHHDDRRRSPRTALFGLVLILRLLGSFHRTTTLAGGEDAGRAARASPSTLEPGHFRPRRYLARSRAGDLETPCPSCSADRRGSRRRDVVGPTRTGDDQSIDRRGRLDSILVSALAPRGHAHRSSPRLPAAQMPRWATSAWPPRRTVERQRCRPGSLHDPCPPAAASCPLLAFQVENYPKDSDASTAGGRVYSGSSSRWADGPASSSSSATA